jgi:hypothetical protein
MQQRVRRAAAIIAGQRRASFVGAECRREVSFGSTERPYAGGSPHKLLSPGSLTRRVSILPSTEMAATAFWSVRFRPQSLAAPGAGTCLARVVLRQRKEGIMRRTSSVGIGYAALLSAITVLAGACGLDPKYPPTATKVYCTADVPDCSQQADRECPNGYRLVDKGTWTTTSTPGYRGIPAHSIRHEKLVIDCEAPRQPTKDQPG